MSKGCKMTGLQTLRIVDFARVRTLADWLKWGRGQVADFFLRPPTLTASNFAAL